jgi:hypothetical protein
MASDESHQYDANGLGGLSSEHNSEVPPTP